MDRCVHPNMEYEGQYTREYPTGIWTLVRTWICRGCHIHTIRRHEMQVSSNYIEEDFVHGADNRLTSASVRTGKGA